MDATLTAATCRSIATDDAYSMRRRVMYGCLAAAAGVAIAGFWNAAAVDGLGRSVAHGTVGDPDALSTTFAVNGAGFGFIFAAVAGIAATFTACNCVVFAILPGLAASGHAAASRRSALSALGVFAAGVLLVGAFYGMFVGLLGPAGVQAFNAPQIRRSMATTVFVALGLIMLVWGAIELGLLDMLTRRASAATRAAMSQTTTKAGALGLMVGWFLVGRPYPVMRDFLVYAAAAHSATYGAAVMMIVGLGQILLMVVVFLALALGGGRLLGWMLARPERRALISGISLVAGGSFFVFYWGLAFTLGIGRWGARLGWY